MKYALPLVGHTLAFGRDPDGFLARCRAAQGDSFELKLPWPRTFLLDPLDHPGVFQNKALSFTDLSLEIGARVFGYHAGEARGWRFEESDQYDHLKGEALAPLTERMSANLVARLDAAAGGGWTAGDLYPFIARHVFAAGIDALFGAGFDSDALYRSYAVIDRYFPLLALGVPARVLPGCRGARRALVEAVSGARPDRSAFLQARLAHFDRHRIRPDARAALDATIIWASQANTVATAFWSVLLILRDREARAAITAEVDRPGGATPLLESALAEVLRLTSLSMVIRRATEDTALALVSGRRLEVRRGQEVCLYARATHMDPEIYAEPRRFVFDRFLARPAPPQFFRRGQRVAFHLIPFGGGANMCPGRFFARNEFKVIVALMLSRYQLELEAGPPPTLNYARVGLGVPPPVGAVRFRLRRRA